MMTTTAAVAAPVDVVKVTTMPKWILLLVLLAIIAVGCNDSSTGSGQAADDDNDNDDDDDNDNDDDDNDDSGPARSFKLAATGFQYAIGDDWVESDYDVSGFAGHVDLLSVHQDFFGIPWDEFAVGAPLPQAWVDKMNQIKGLADGLGAGVFLSLTPLSGMRDGLHAMASDEGGELVVEDYPTPGCFNFQTGPNAAAIRTAYKAYARWMIDLFAPEFIAHAIELNMYDFSCPAEYLSLLTLLNEVYDREKALDAQTPIFPTFMVKEMWGYDELVGGCEIGDRSCLEDNLAKVADLKMDRFCISDYPAVMQYEWDEIPADYYSAPGELTGLKVVWGEIGYPNKPTVLPFPTLEDDCLEVFANHDQEQIAFLERLFADAQMLDSDLVTWWSFRDFLPAHVIDNCPCQSPGLWCIIYDAMYDAGLLGAWLHWGAMGMLDFDVQSKPALALWDQWYGRPVAQ